MENIHPQFVVDEKDSRQAVILTLDEWERILESLEELDDIRAYDLAKAGPQERMPFEEAINASDRGKV